MGKLEGKVALITGSGSGIGRAAALLFAREGARVAVADMVVAGGQETVGMIKDTGGQAHFIQVDVSKATDIERMVKTTVEVFGRVDVLYNNAGIQGAIAPVAEFSEGDWDSIININLKSVFLGSKFTLPIMLGQGGGVIVNTSSAMGLSGKDKCAAYSVSKAGVIALTKSMAAEYGKQNIRVNAICPGMIETPLSARAIPSIQMEYVPQGRAGRPQDIAQAALYLACDDSAYVTGSVIVVDGGWTAALILPRK
jgi:NAD(P)-dependent dehydrogenase (short-subunit alcohol dehydrogenase family)